MTHGAIPPARMRLARLSDVDALTAIFDEASVRGGIQVPPEVAMTESLNVRRELQQVIAKKAPDHHVVVAIDNETDTVLGYVEYRQEDADTILIEQLYAKENTVRAGRRLLGHVAAYATHHGAKRLRTCPLPKARGYYLALGFEDNAAQITGDLPSVVLPLRHAYRLSA